jgi:hypothetical protein
MNTVQKGGQFERKILTYLTDYTFKMRQVGGRSDGGVDLRGSILLGPKQWNVLVQCKCEDRKPGPKYIREFVGVLGQEVNTFGILATSSQWTMETRLAFLHSDCPLMGMIIDGQNLNWSLNYKLQRMIPGLISSSHQLYYHQKSLL